ncbi:hypothetical protein NC653_027311 [Populus alba x Populus x berolinensis]|uniref:Uncharacterized protein n=1 Tax=Populus alba x Populus x berolinensis TaxID=444605 RepID=A0AAD6M630_9ROSI|nr:hypothetical protein NC653_027311 [Populus alba x Populus x berolinensis]
MTVTATLLGRLTHACLATTPRFFITNFSLQIEATLSSGHSQLLKTMKELTANSSKDALGPESLINLMTIPREWLKTMTNKLQFQFSPLNFTHIPNIITLFYSHSKHYITP